MKSYLIQIIDNDPKGESNGTLYKLSYTTLDNELKTIIYSIMDEINRTSIYKEVCSIYNSFIEYGKNREKVLNAQLEKDKEDSRKEILLKNKLTEEQVQIIATVLEEEKVSVEKYKNGNEKILNSIIGRCIKHIGSVPPLVIKEYIIDKL